jgi:hypothetical protein
LVVERRWKRCAVVCDKIDLDAARGTFIYPDVEQVILVADGREEGIESEPGCYHC